MMFALGIIDTLSDGNLNGGEQVAGTGTIDASGTVGPLAITEGSSPGTSLMVSVTTLAGWQAAARRRP